MAAVLCSQGSFAFVGGVGSCFWLFRASIKGGELWLLVVLTGAEHNDVCSACEGTTGCFRQLGLPKDPGETGRGRGQSAKQGYFGLNMPQASYALEGMRGNAWEWCRCQQILAEGSLFSHAVC